MTINYNTSSNGTTGKSDNLMEFKQRYRVFVTGYAANKHHPTNKLNNPAGEIAAIMPLRLAADDPLNSSGAEIEFLRDGIPEDWIKFDGGYLKKRNIIKEIFEKHSGNLDLWIHLGRMGQSSCYRCERRAFSQDFTSSWRSPSGYYNGPDNTDHSIGDIGPNPWSPLNVPLGLHTDLDVTKVVREAGEVFKKHFVAKHGGQEGQIIPDMVSHVEAGSMGCGYVYYEILANFWVAAKVPSAMFVHVPPEVDKKTLEIGRDAILAVISASIADIISRIGETPEEKLTRYFKEP